MTAAARREIKLTITAKRTPAIVALETVVPGRRPMLENCDIRYLLGLRHPASHLMAIVAADAPRVVAMPKYCFK